jgi:mono/diheme cytochrome c family protein
VSAAGAAHASAGRRFDRRGWSAAGALVAIVIACLALPAAAQTAAQLSFIPSGGRTLLSNVAAGKPSAGEFKPLLTGKHTRDEWVAYLDAHATAMPALKRLSEKERLTLADYLSFHMPLPASQVPADFARTDWTRNLPQDGRDLTLDNCQGCHIITVVVTQVRTRTYWLSTANTPSHAVIKALNAVQREELASYLELNAGIPIEQVPEELRAAGATY